MAIAFSSACTVENSSETQNAFQDCNPTSQQITDFHTTVFQADLQGCVSCHGTQEPAAAISDAPPFLVNPANTEDEQKANFCAVYLRGQESPSVVIFNYPQSSNHGSSESPVQFLASDLQNIKTFIQTVTLETTDEEATE